MIDLKAELSISDDLQATLGEQTRLDATLADVFVAGVTSWNGLSGAVEYTAPVTSVNGQTGTVNISIPVVPTNVSAFNNDVGYLTSVPVTSVNGQTGAVVLSIPTVPSDVSSFNNDAGYLTLSTLPVYDGGVS